MGIAFRKKHKNYVQYTSRIREDILDKIKEIAYKEDLSINETINQCLEYVIEEYSKEKSKE